MNIETKRAEALARIQARQIEAAKEQARRREIAEMRLQGRRARLHIEAGIPLVSFTRTFDLREDVFDAVRNSTRAAAYFDNYDLAMMGGEPYSEWN